MCVLKKVQSYICILTFKDLYIMANDNQKNSFQTQPKADSDAVVPTSQPVIDSVVQAVTLPPEVKAKSVEAIATGSSGVVVMQSEVAPPRSNFLPPEVKVEKAVMTGVIEYALAQYVQKMKPGVPMTPEEGAVQQRLLWKTLQNLLEKTPEEDFQQAFNTALKIFKEFENGAFGDQYVMRFMSDVHLDRDEIYAFQAIINLMKKTADKATRSQMLKQVDLSRSLSRTFTEAARQRVLSFFNV